MDEQSQIKTTPWLARVAIIMEKYNLKEKATGSKLQIIMIIIIRL